jgi:hypothetical protein
MSFISVGYIANISSETIEETSSNFDITNRSEFEDQGISANVGIGVLF